MIDIQPARGRDLALKALLEGAGLPTDDLEDSGRMFFLASAGGSVCGSGGFETAGSDILLRSIAVNPDYRGQGLGKTITMDVLERARRCGAVRAYLLTTSAAPFFESLGFARIDRAAAPEAILRTRQAASICPASAVLMVKGLTA
ncbi:arsenic resistance N-acetyltransferase ArsN2 [Rhizobium sp. Root1204]|uniref:arsenic resistance N-acetyltransferase ArsN2 n=1 Tax=Rhizobium sp. Root1204 TaxID=1736428 RepID=UPI0007160E6E|nr:arsenic resistance N-acetyltransferase ArsN2 [Rhizobium sp. Root1204]KQV36288.1 acetyltransferase [Rhizobium sp. Root1204]